MPCHAKMVSWCFKLQYTLVRPWDIPFRLIRTEVSPVRVLESNIPNILYSVLLAMQLSEEKRRVQATRRIFDRQVLGQ